MARKSKIYKLPEYKKWRKLIFMRDRYKCRLCSYMGDKLEGHHIIKKSVAPELTYQRDNGITLCKECHEIITGKEEIYEEFFFRIIKLSINREYMVSFMREHVAKDFINHSRLDKIPLTIKKIVDFYDR